MLLTLNHRILCISKMFTNFILNYRGLDSLSCSQCISLLKSLVSQGRNIICTIHQPSALVLEMFDKLYTLAEGNCLYNGTISDLLPHLDVFGISCPTYHNPADFRKLSIITFNLLT